MVYKIVQVDDPEELKAHGLDVLHAKLKIKQMQDKENEAIGGDASNAGLSNSMMGGFGSSGNDGSFHVKFSFRLYRAC